MFHCDFARGAGDAMYLQNWQVHVVHFGFKTIVKVLLFVISKFVGKSATFFLIYLKFYICILPVATSDKGCVLPSCKLLRHGITSQ